MNLLIIQARMGSSRLPGKVLMKVEDKPLLKFMIDRVRKSKKVDEVIVATTEDTKDDPIAMLCKKNNIGFYRGSENDVLDRFYQASKPYNPDTIIRLTADCPLVDPEIIDEIIELFTNTNVDYAANTVPPEKKKYPDGSDVEVFKFSALKRAWEESTDLKDREHVTFYFWKHDKNFTTAMLDNKYDWGNYRITIDYKEDFIVVEKIIQQLKNQRKEGSISEIIELLQNNPEIENINSNYTWGMNW